MQGFYEKMKEVWRSIKTTLKIADTSEKDAYEDLCDRLRSDRPIEMSELAWIEELCKKIAEPGCEQRIGEGFEKLKRGIEWKIAKEVGVTRKRGLEEVRSEHVGVDEEKAKKHRRSGYQKKGQLRKENDVSWGVLPKKYRKEGMTPAETIERAISYDAEENLFLCLGEVSTSEEEMYFGEENVKKLCQSDMHSKRIGCNFGGEYNCKSCVEYEIRKEYEAKENERKEHEEEESRMRRRAAKEKWEAKIPRRCFYFEKEFGIDRGVMRYATDDKFDIEDLESEDRDKLERILNQAKRGKLFDVSDGASHAMDMNGVDDAISGYEGFADDRKMVDNESRVVKDMKSKSWIDNGSGVVNKVTEKELDSVNGMKQVVNDGNQVNKVGSDMKTAMEEADVEEPKQFGFWNAMNSDIGNATRSSIFGSEPALKKNGVDDVNDEGHKEIDISERSRLNDGMGQMPLLMNRNVFDNPFAGETKMYSQKVFEAEGNLKGNGEMVQGSIEGFNVTDINSGQISLKRKLGDTEKSQDLNRLKQEAPPFVFGGMMTDRQIPMFGFNNNDKEKAEVPVTFSVNGFGGHAAPEYMGFGGQAVFGTGKSLFGGLFSNGDAEQQPAKPSIGYADTQSTGEEHPTKNMFGVGILNAMEEDPFERNIWNK
ncbi:hypothetical protein CWI42_100060 [Ordospora colligata]|uniref:Uncharacterized protein n=1 Tax=Ordospora colligata OC4 TaxID=1354746 RepID=A0A0B2UIY7_9MICR|nr:uncharacterized protein M896_100060 [Ordospora colligata OC4]KHN69022.1 hypothetical protein M896_100060 [Ordospora colligata OC4]TBU14303.1 hypothetical protein CWI40_100070 [Ordospora colligata]TBU14368.1 hypothetical protein CWI41_100070 [Ordospora colligata]TBU17984.1 hypothetical protein CWI42_100060 [Ordospora colligata]